MRIQKFLSSCGVVSRRKAEILIKQGKIFVNGVPSLIGQKINPKTDIVSINGKIVSPNKYLVYVAFNKPVGCISSCSNKQGTSVFDLVKNPYRLFPVGRLDKDSEGLMILTNDGKLANRLTHPKYGCEKEYEVLVDKTLSNKELDNFKNGVLLEDGKTQPCIIKMMSNIKYLVVLKEGKNRQIRRMFQAFGKKVLRLKRVRIKNLRLGNLKVGHWRYLTEKEIKLLKNTANGS